MGVRELGLERPTPFFMCAGRARRVPEADLLAGSRAKADAAVAPVVLHHDVTERDAAQQRARSPVVKHAQAVRACLTRVHEQVVQRARAQYHPLQITEKAHISTENTR